MATALRTRIQAPKRCERYQNMLIELPPASGKTRIAIAYILSLACLWNNKNTKIYVVVIHPTKVLMDQDDNQWNEVARLVVSYGIDIKRFCSYDDAKGSINCNAIVVVDEFDYVMFDLAVKQPFKLFEKSYKGLLALTATPPITNSSCYQDLFKQLYFHRIIDEYNRE